MDKTNKIYNKNIINFISFIIKNAYKFTIFTDRIIINDVNFIKNKSNDNIYYYNENIKINIDIIELKHSGILTEFENIKLNYDLNKKIKQLKILMFLNKQNNIIHTPILYNTVYFKNSEKILVFSEFLNDTLFNFINNQSVIDNNFAHIIINMIQQLLMVIIFYHTKTGLINTNINSKNIYYKKNKIASNTYIKYKLFRKNYYIKHHGYMWYLTDYSESIKMSSNKDILFNKTYDSYHMYCEFKVILHIIKNSNIYLKNHILDTYINNILTKLNSNNLEKFKYYCDTKYQDNRVNIIDELLFSLIKDDMSLIDDNNFTTIININNNSIIYNDFEYDITTLSLSKNAMIDKDVLLLKNIDSINFEIIKNI